MASSKIETRNNNKYIIKINSTACIGCSTCSILAENTFSLGQDNKAQIKPNGFDHLNNLLMAAQACPTGSIIIIDKTSKKQIWPKGK